MLRSDRGEDIWVLAEQGPPREPRLEKAERKQPVSTSFQSLSGAWGAGGGAVQGRIVPKQGPRRSGLCVKHVRFGAERLEKEFSTRMGRKRGSGSLLRWTKF